MGERSDLLPRIFSNKAIMNITEIKDNIDRVVEGLESRLDEFTAFELEFIESIDEQYCCNRDSFTLSDKQQEVFEEIMEKFDGRY